MLRKFLSRVWMHFQKVIGLQPPPSNPVADSVIAFYAANYRLVDPNIGLLPTDKRYLRDRAAKTCRFCRKSEPEVKFTQETDALPEATGNKSLITDYECDTCNDKFGRGIDTEFGKWSKPLRTFYQVRGKDGVPTLKREGPTGWRIELKQDGFVFQQHEDNPVVDVDEANDRVTIEVPIDRHVPIAVFKAFVKMALSLLPGAEVEDFKLTFQWLQETIHTRPFHPDIARLYYTFTPGPRPFEGVTTFLFIRKETAPPLPHCVFVIAFGNECYQMFVPCPVKDRALDGTKVQMPILPTPYHSIDSPFGELTPPRTYDLSGTEPTRGTIKRIFHAQIRPAAEKPATDKGA